MPLETYIIENQGKGLVTSVPSFNLRKISSTSSNLTVPSVLIFRDTVATFDDLDDIISPVQGDVYGVVDENSLYVYIEDYNNTGNPMWVNLGLTVDLSDYATTQWVIDNFVNLSQIASVVKFRDNVSDYASLPSSGNIEGDLYKVLDTDEHYIWVNDLDNTGVPGWNKLSSSVDLTGYATETYVDNAVSDLEISINTDLDNKLDKTTTTIANVDSTWKWIYIMDDSNNTRRLLYEDNIDSYKFSLTQLRNQINLGYEGVKVSLQNQQVMGGVTSAKYTLYKISGGLPVAGLERTTLTDINNDIAALNPTEVNDGYIISFLFEFTAGTEVGSAGIEALKL